MIIYIIERDNPYERPEPQVVKHWIEALAIVKNEYEEQLKELDITQDMIDNGTGCYGCYWEFEDGQYYGSAVIDSDYDLDKWEWRITEHFIEL